MNSHAMRWCSARKKTHLSTETLVILPSAKRWGRLVVFENLNNVKEKQVIKQLKNSKKTLLLFENLNRVNVPKGRILQA